MPAEAIFEFFDEQQGKEGTEDMAGMAMSLLW